MPYHLSRKEVLQFFLGRDRVRSSRMDFVAIELLMSRQGGPGQGEAVSRQRKIVL